MSQKLLFRKEAMTILTHGRLTQKMEANRVMTANQRMRTSQTTKLEAAMRIKMRMKSLNSATKMTIMSPS